MEYELENGKLVLNKELTDLDNLVIDFVSILKAAGIRYVIISGYVAIFFGRTRTTEDVDIFIEKIENEKLVALFKVLDDKGYWIINSENPEAALELLNEYLSLRVARKGEAVPNFEIKLPKKKLDFYCMENPLEISVNGNNMPMSPFEVEIPFKLWLGSDKDIEDATHIYELFKDKLNKELMRNIAAELNVENQMVKYGFE